MVQFANRHLNSYYFCVSTRLNKLKLPRQNIFNEYKQKARAYLLTHRIDLL